MAATLAAVNMFARQHGAFGRVIHYQTGRHRKSFSRIGRRTRSKLHCFRRRSNSAAKSKRARLGIRKRTGAGREKCLYPSSAPRTGIGGTCDLAFAVHLGDRDSRWKELAYAEAFEVPIFILLHHVNFEQLKTRHGGGPSAGLVQPVYAWRLDSNLS